MGCNASSQDTAAVQNVAPKAVPPDPSSRKPPAQEAELGQESGPESSNCIQGPEVQAQTHPQQQRTAKASAERDSLEQRLLPDGLAIVSMGAEPPDRELAMEEGDKVSQEKATSTPWGRFIILWFCCTLASGILPGQALFIELFAKAGVFSSVCSAGDSTCKDQYLSLTGVFQGGATLAYCFLPVIGLFFDQWGARAVGTAGAAVCAFGLLLVWVSVQGAALGQDANTSAIFGLGVIVCDFGSMLNSFAFIGLIWHFPGRQALVLTLSNATYQVSAFLPIALEFLMRLTGLSLAGTMLAYAGLVTVITYICWLIVPTQAEFFREAKRTLGMPLPRPPDRIRACHMLGRAWEVLRMNSWDHIASGLALAFGFAFPGFYASLAAPYGEALFGSKEAGNELATLYVSLNGFVGLVLAPFVGSLADRFGLLIFVLVLGLIQTVAVFTCGFPSWPAQAVCATALVLFSTLLTLFISRYLLLYSPPNRFGTVQGVYALVVMLASMPSTFGGLGLTAVLPEGPIAYQIPMWIFGSSGALALYAYAWYFMSHPPPDVPTLLPDDEAELARNFGCSSLEQVMYVTHIQTRKQLLKMLAATDPEVTYQLIRSIDTERMMEMMAKLDLEDIATMMETGGVGEEDEEEEVGQQETAESRPLLENRQDSKNSIKSYKAGLALALAPAGESERRIRLLGDRYAALVVAGDKDGLRAYLLQESVEDLWAVTLDMETRFTEAERKKTDKDFSKLIPGGEFAKLLRQRAELRSLVQKIMKRELDRKVAWMKGKKR